MGTCASIPNNGYETSSIEDAPDDSIHMSSISGCSERPTPVDVVEPVFFSKQERRIILPSSSSSSIEYNKPSTIVDSHEIVIPFNEIPIIKVMSPQNKEVLIIGSTKESLEV